MDDKLKIRVSQRFQYSDFGVRGRDTVIEGHCLRQSGRFICTGVPGTGFFERESESDSYIQFVADYSHKMRWSAWKYLMGKEFSYDKEIALVNESMSVATDLQRKVLESYGNCLLIAKEVEFLYRVVKGVKKKMGNHPTKRYTSAISHTRSRINVLSHEMRNCRVNVDKVVSEDVMHAYFEFCQVFMATANSRRLWALKSTKDSIAMSRVFWDVGVFDYIRSPYDTPVMRDGFGICYYIYPTHVLVARSTVDFDLIPINDIHVEYREASGEALTNTKATLDYMYGRTLGEVYFNELNLNFYFAHRSVAHKIVDAFNTYRDYVVDHNVHTDLNY